MSTHRDADTIAEITTNNQSQTHHELLLVGRQPVFNVLGGLAVKPATAAPPPRLRHHDQLLQVVVSHLQRHHTGEGGVKS